MYFFFGFFENTVMGFFLLRAFLFHFWERFKGENGGGRIKYFKNQGKGKIRGAFYGFLVGVYFFAGGDGGFLK